MSTFRKTFQVCNPSPYARDDYVDVALDTLCVPDMLDDRSLKLSRLDGPAKQHEIAYQIDRPFGADADTRVMTFLSGNTPGGPENYSAASATFLLEEGIPTASVPSFQKENLWVGHYYTQPTGKEPADGFNNAWTPGREVTGVKLFNGSLEVYFSLVAHPRFLTAVNYCGAATSVILKRAEKMTDPGASPSMLVPYEGREEDVRKAYWGQITKLVFFRLPWEQRWYHTENLLHKDNKERKYDLVFSHSGAMRTVVTLKSEPILTDYICSPYLKPETLEIRCNLYRIIYLYPEKEYYTEELYLRTEEGRLLSFRAYYSSRICYPTWAIRQSAKFEHIPDYFAVWRHFANFARGFGFACDTHCRERSLESDDISWRLQLSPTHKCIHYFAFEGVTHGEINPFHTIGHSGWYERVFKPLEVIPLCRYISPPTPE